MNRRRWIAWGSVVLFAPAAGACGGSESSAGGSTEVVVFAASSLTEAFEDVADVFAEAHPDYSVVFNFGASSRLAAQIREGAPADVYASADPANMAQLEEAGDVREPILFASNEAALAVEPGNPLGIAGVADLGDPGVVFVACAEEVPCGAYASQVLEQAGIEAEPVSFEANVKAVVTKVGLGEADAGIVYATDVRAGADVDAVPIPAGVNVVAEYPIAVTSDAAGSEAARQFVAFVVSAPGQAILADHGFGSP